MFRMTSLPRFPIHRLYVNSWGREKIKTRRYCRSFCSSIMIELQKSALPGMPGGLKLCYGEIRKDYLKRFSLKRMMMVAIWARVAVALGARSTLSPEVTPLITSFSVAQRRASRA